MVLFPHNEASFFMKKVLFPLLLICASVAGGAVNGLLGTGGGIIFAYFFKYLEKRGQAPEGTAFPSTMAVILPISLLSFTTYESAVGFDVPFILKLAIPSAIGGLIGAYLSSKVKPVFLERLFAILVIYAGIKMLF